MYPQAVFQYLDDVETFLFLIQVDGIESLELIMSNERGTTVVDNNNYYILVVATHLKTQTETKIRETKQ